MSLPFERHSEHLFRSPRKADKQWPVGGLSFAIVNTGGLTLRAKGKALIRGTSTSIKVNGNTSGAAMLGYEF